MEIDQKATEFGVDVVYRLINTGRRGFQFRECYSRPDFRNVFRIVCSRYTPPKMKSLSVFSLLVLGSSMMFAQNSVKLEVPSSADVDAVFPEAKALYLDLHQHPELSKHEVETAAKLATKLRNLQRRSVAQSSKRF